MVARVIKQVVPFIFVARVLINLKISNLVKGEDQGRCIWIVRTCADVTSYKLKILQR